MNIHQNPELLDRLAAAYALGALRGGARRRFEQLAREHPAVRVAAVSWQGRMAAVNELQAPVEAPGQVWTRIHNLVQADQQARQMDAVREPSPPRPAANPPWWQCLAPWRTAAGAGALATALAVVVGLEQQDRLQSRAAEVAALQTELAAQARVEYVAVLSDPKAGAALLVTFDASTRQLVLQRVNDFDEGADRSLQLWALPPDGRPRSLGVLGEGRLQQLAADRADVQQVPTLAISLEPKGGVPSEGGPTGPVLYTGSLIRKLL